MSRKAFQVQVELDVQAVTCPGVWLCSNGKVSLQIYMLDSCVQTASYKPIFPIQCSETFVFYKTFLSKHQLHELQRELHDQWLYIELTTLDELLYPSTINGSIAGVDLDLLMEPTKTFPGTIAPKVEVSTKTTIEETLCVCTKPTPSTVVVNPKVITSTQRKTRKNVCRRVCHSVSYSRKKRPFKCGKSRPPFCYRKAEDDLILRKPNYETDDKCTCRESKSVKRISAVRIEKPELMSKQSQACPCVSKKCPLCAKYKGYFDTVRYASEEQEKADFPTQPRTNLFDANKMCSKHSKNAQCHCCRSKAWATSEEKSDAGETVFSDEEKKKVCLCFDQKPSLAEKLHAKLAKTLSSIPRSIEWSCYDNEYECQCCQSPNSSSRAELYRDLQRFYGELYEKSRSSALCVPECPGAK
ncbi:uncharacterized protein LOC123014521 isoform X2 [Tribolium madens]|uniref:uncharacterized protein LOC123014521 isoform X2 n=1 Tax=Tribolium madens TaxID=41895 RepID=UPI001CF75E59|nr:uncharacterized protein LOC123014521 isoform X2 [Tribolium madens]